MIPDDDNPELTKFMVAMRFAGHGDFAAWLLRKSTRDGGGNGVRHKREKSAITCPSITSRIAQNRF